MYNGSAVHGNNNELKSYDVAHRRRALKTMYFIEATSEYELWSQEYSQLGSCFT